MNGGQPPGKATWFELFVLVNDREVDTDAIDPPAEQAFNYAAELIHDLGTEQDIGSWAVYCLPHWCDKNQRGECGCDEYRDQIALKKFRGMTLDELRRR